MAKGSKIKIVIGMQGFVWIGYYEYEGDQIVIRNPYNVRRWRENGLGALCGGPTEGMELDKIEGPGKVELLRLVEVASYECALGPWEDWFASQAK